MVHRRAPLQRSPRSLGSLIAGFKQASTVAVNQARGTAGAKIWQRGFFEHVVWNDEDIDRIAWYIGTNPERWETDEESQSL